MIDIKGVYALDGHDGAGKTSLALWFAPTVGGVYQRPFQGKLGAQLMKAAIGKQGICNALSAAGSRRPVILDRAWMTVASLLPWDDFSTEWDLWIPTVLCWADLKTTLDRLALRTEAPESIDMHKYYIHVYRSLAEISDSCIIRTDLSAIPQCHELLIRWYDGKIPMPRR
jgi:hypothetical protein